MAKEIIKRHFIYFVFTTLVIALQFCMNLWQSPQNANMDVGGNLFFYTGAFSHACIGALILYIFAILIALISRNRLVTAIVHISLASFFNIFLYINSYVFALYRFHINGMVLGMYFGEGGDQIFQFDISLYFRLLFMLIVIIVGNILLYKWAGLLYRKCQKTFYLYFLTVFVVMTLYSNIVHAYAAVVEYQTVLRSATHIPFYYPVTATRMMMKMGVVSQDKLLQVNYSKQTDFKYPKNEIIQKDTVPPYNIVIIAVDSWNSRGLTEETMPVTFQFKQDNMFYANHLSSSNSTGGSIFGMFFGVTSYYWDDFEMSGTTPVLIDELQKRGYQIQTFPSATFLNPNFAKVIFRKVKGLNTDTEGETVFDRDCQLTQDFEQYLDTINTEKPFFAFLFYDLAHSGEYPKKLKKKFLPSWDFPDYMKLNNDMDPTPFWNLYRNCLNAVDSLVAITLNHLERKKLTDNTYIIITGDHGQEFNENHKNNWGHSGYITYPKLHVPLIIHYPDRQKGVVNYRTTHYDISTTLLSDVLGVDNHPSNYSMGLNLNDSTFRDWHIVGNKENFAFIIKNNIIIEKRKSGILEINDSLLNPMENYKVNSVELNNAIKKMNMFYNQN